MAGPVPKNKIEWSLILEVWLGFGPERNLRYLKSYIKNIYGVSIDVPMLRYEITKRGWHIKALEYDKQIDAEVNAKTTEALVEKLVKSRLSGISKISEKADMLGDVLENYIQSNMKHMERRGFRPADLNAIVGAFTKMEAMKQTLDAPVLPEDIHDTDVNLKLTPETLANALLHISKRRSITIKELHQEKPKLKVINNDD